MKHIIQNLTRYHDIKQFVHTHEKKLLPTMLMLGVAIDFITFKNIKLTSTFAILGIHYVILGLAIIQSHIHPRTTITRYIHTLSPLALQFSLGALLSASLIFYWYSGTLSISWPILSVIAVLMFSNELFRDYFKRAAVQMSAYYFVSYSLLTLILPHTFKSISIWLFITAGIISAAIILGFTYGAGKTIQTFKNAQSTIYKTIGVIFLTMNALYAANIIPPIPLALKDAGAYHDIARPNGAYALTTEHETWLQKIIPGQTIHNKKGESIFVFSAIFAPTELNTIIYHQWEYYDRTVKKWIKKDRLHFTIRGGRNDGYRGYSRKASVAPGTWRVSVETKDGRTLGRIRFNVMIQNEATRTRIITK